MPTKSSSSTTTEPIIPCEDALTILRANPRAFSYEPEHPGVILREEFLDPLGVTPYRLAAATGMSQTRIGEILRGERSITADAAVRLAVALETTAELWLGLQSDYDLRSFLASKGRKVVSTVKSLREPADQAAPRRDAR
jgi:addiction module HigA family antidote